MPQTTIVPPAPLRPEERINVLTAQPDQHPEREETPLEDPDEDTVPMELGPASEADAIESGYTDENGRARP